MNQKKKKKGGGGYKSKSLLKGCLRRTVLGLEAFVENVSVLEMPQQVTLTPKLVTLKTRKFTATCVNLALSIGRSIPANES